MLPKIQICLSLAGEKVEFSDITERLGLKPTKVRKKGEFKAYGLVEVEKEAWEYRTKIRKIREISEPLSRLQNFLADKIDIINELGRRYSLETYIIVTIRTDAYNMLELFLSEENVEFLSRLNAGIQFDMHVDY